MKHLKFKYDNKEPNFAPAIGMTEEQIKPYKVLVVDTAEKFQKSDKKSVNFKLVEEAFKGKSNSECALMAYLFWDLCKYLHRQEAARENPLAQMLASIGATSH